MNATLPTGVVTFLLTDVEGSTILWEKDDAAMQKAMARHHEIAFDVIKRHKGARPQDQGEGDSIVGAFAKATDAVACALDLQLTLAKEQWPTASPIKVRIGIHTGEIELRDDRNYFGFSINRCARVRAVAHGQQTLLSQATANHVRDSLPKGAWLTDLGQHRLKDLADAESLFQLCHADLPQDFSPLRSVDAVPNNLPAQVTSLVGRDAELLELSHALEQGRLVTLTGAGGCGKTRIAVHVAANMIDRHPEGVWWIELAPVSVPELVPDAVARTLGLRNESNRPLIDTLCDQLADSNALLVLDNCEQVLDAAAHIVDTLLRAAPDLRVIATSREPLGISGELTWRVPSLDVDSGARLFLERAAAVRPKYAPSSEEIEVITRICSRLGGIPHAIELAAARTRMMHPARIEAELDDRFRLLTGGGRTVMPRQQTLEASVAWSHDLLDEMERALLRRLSVFASGFTLHAAERVCSDEMVDEYAVLDLVSRLVDKSLVQAEHGDLADRYRMHETIRMYARDRLVESGESEAIRSRHCKFFLSLAEQAEPELVGADAPAWLAQLELEHDNIRGALEWADIAGADEQFLRLVTSLTLFWEYRGHLAAGGRWFARALAHNEGPSVARARALWGAAHVALYTGAYEFSMLRASEALAMATTVSDEWAMARAFNTLGVNQAWMEPEAARAELLKSLEIGRKVGDKWAVADGLKMITVACLMQEDHEGFAGALEEMREVAEDLQNKFFTSWYHCGVGYVALRRGEFSLARSEFEISIDESRQVGEPSTEGLALCWLGELDALTGDYEAAQTRLSAFLQRAAATGGELSAPYAMLTLATIAMGRDNPTEARSILEPIIEQLRSWELPYLPPSGLVVLGSVLLADGNDEVATSVLEESKDRAERLSNPWLIAITDYHLGRLAHRQGHHGQAEDLHHKGLALLVLGAFRPEIAQSLEALAALAAEHESYLEATRLFAAAAALRGSMGLARWPAEQADYEVQLERIRIALGELVFDTTWAEGEALTLEEAVSYATRARGERRRPSSGWASLTPTELEVVRFAAQGLTNPQIAERMFVARGTVKIHLSHIFAKLGYSTRSELAGEAVRRAI